MSAPPKTILHASPEEEAAIRAAVREARGFELGHPRRSLVTLDDVGRLGRFFSDPGVSDWIYDLPRPVTDASVRAWIEERLARHQRGECVLSIITDEDGEVISYSDITVWPQHASGELAGAMRSDRQNTGQGSANVLATFDWIFEGLGARLMCLTASLENVRSQKMIDNAGFVRMGERDGVRPDGSTRRSVYWEQTRDQWRARKASRPG
jgi:RimJ/RimL family protein N-acetyltransferase